jgi:PPOX class probable F420-dependent enzyme
MVDIPETHRDLLDARVLTLATIAPDGRPQLSEVLFLVENGDIRISLNDTRKKVRNLRDNPACTAFILDLANPQRYLEIRGDAEITPDGDYVFADRVGAKYGLDVRNIDQPGESRVAVTLRPTRVNAVDMSR